MIACGIEIEGRRAIFSVLQRKGEHILDVTGKFTQLKIKNDENPDEIRSYFNTIKSHFDSIKPDKIAIIQRQKKGMFTSGPITFKIEGLIQCYTNQDVILISPHTLRKFDKENYPEIIPKFKYQKNSYLLALYLLKE